MVSEEPACRKEEQPGFTAAVDCKWLDETQRCGGLWLYHAATCTAGKGIHTLLTELVFACGRYLLASLAIHHIDSPHLRLPIV